MEVKIAENVKIDILDDALMLLNTETNKVIEINDIGKIIIENIQKNNFLDMDIVSKEINKEYEVSNDKEDIKADIVEFINGLIKIGILVN